jgi:hypothetical protein
MALWTVAELERVAVHHPFLTPDQPIDADVHGQHSNEVDSAKNGHEVIVDSRTLGKKVWPRSLMKMGPDPVSYYDRG